MSKFTDGLSSAAGGAVIGLGSSILGGLADSLFGSDSTDTQKEMMDYQSSLNAGLMRLQAELNSPATIAKEYQKAGFNPYVTMGSGVGSSGGQAAGSSVSVPEAAYSAIPSQIGLLTADSLQKLAGAYKSAKEGSVVKDVAGSQIAKNKADADLSSSQKHLNDIDAKFKEVYGDEYNSLRNQKLQADVKKTFQDANTALAQQNLLEAEESCKQLEEIINNELIKSHQYENQRLGIYLNEYPAMLRTQIKLMKAQSNEANQRAALAGEQADYQRFMNMVYSNNEVRTALADQLVTAAEIAKSSKHMTDAQVAQIKQYTAQLKKATDNYEIQMWSNLINQTINTAANAVGEFTKFGLAKKFLSAPNISPIESGRGYMMQDGVLMLNPVR